MPPVTCSRISTELLGSVCIALVLPDSAARTTPYITQPTPAEPQSCVLLDCGASRRGRATHGGRGLDDRWIGDEIRGANDFSFRDFMLRRDRELRRAFDPRRAAAAQLNGTKAREHRELERIHADWTFDHSSLTCTGFGEGLAGAAETQKSGTAD